MIISPASPEHLTDIVSWRQEASAWLAEKGIDQWRVPWPTAEKQDQRILDSILAGETWVIQDGQALVATVALDSHADPGLWTPGERAQPARYLHRLIVRRRYAGRDLGAEVIDWASTRAAREGAQWLRIDVWTGNDPLQNYYRRLGFEHVRTLHTSYPSGALFQRPTGILATPRLYEQVPQR